jgi:hypothetical protein
MFRSVDLKSLLIGSLLVLAVLCILGATPSPVPSAPCGRFTIVVSDANADAFVLDTVTGQVWSRNTLYSENFIKPKLVAEKPRDPNEPRTK